MPQYLPIKITEVFGGLNCTSTPDNVKNQDSPDCRNNDLSTPGAEIKRNGLLKTTTTAYAYQINFMVQCAVKGESYTLIINSNGEIITV